LDELSLTLLVLLCPLLDEVVFLLSMKLLELLLPLVAFILFDTKARGHVLNSGHRDRRLERRPNGLGHRLRGGEGARRGRLNGVHSGLEGSEGDLRGRMQRRRPCNLRH